MDRRTDLSLPLSPTFLPQSAIYRRAWDDSGLVQTARVSGEIEWPCVLVHITIGEINTATTAAQTTLQFNGYGLLSVSRSVFANTAEWSLVLLLPSWLALHFHSLSPYPLAASTAERAPPEQRSSTIGHLCVCVCVWAGDTFTGRSSSANQATNTAHHFFVNQSDHQSVFLASA